VHARRPEAVAGERLGGRDRRRRALAEYAAHGLDLGHVARLHLVQAERAIADADQPVHRQPHRGHRPPDLAVLALADADGQPGIGALLPVQLHLHRQELVALQHQPAAQRIEGGIVGLAIHPNAVFPQPAGLRQLQRALEVAIVGQQQQAFGIEVEAPDAHHPRHPLGHGVEHGLAALLVLLGRHEAERLVIEPQPRRLLLVDRLSIQRHPVARAHVERRAVDDLAIHRHAAGNDHLLGVAARGDAYAGHQLGDALALRAFGGIGCHGVSP